MQLYRGIQRQFSENICSEDELRSGIFETFVVTFSCLPASPRIFELLKRHLHARAKKIGTARQTFGTVLTILRHGTPNFRRLNVSVPNAMWHQCSKF